MALVTTVDPKSEVNVFIKCSPVLKSAFVRLCLIFGFAKGYLVKKAKRNLEWALRECVLNTNSVAWPSLTIHNITQSGNTATQHKNIAWTLRQSGMNGNNQYYQVVHIRQVHSNGSIASDWALPESIRFRHGIKCTLAAKRLKISENRKSTGPLTALRNTNRERDISARRWRGRGRPTTGQRCLRAPL